MKFEDLLSGFIRLHILHTMLRSMRSMVNGSSSVLCMKATHGQADLRFVTIGRSICWDPVGLTGMKLGSCTGVLLSSVDASKRRTIFIAPADRGAKFGGL